MKSFVPLECNPDVFNKFLSKLDIGAVEFVDVYGLDPDLLAFVPRPVRAVLLVFPYSETYEKYRQECDQRIERHDDIAWSKQTIKNSCGTMALIHALANGLASDSLGNGIGKSLVNEFKSLPASDRPAYLEGSETLEKMHGQIASGGDTVALDAEADVDFHYVCLTKSGNRLVELDGRRRGPIVRAEGIDEPDLFAVPELISIVKEYMEREANSTQFAIIALIDKH